MQEIKKTKGMINFKRAKHWTAHTTPESVENITDSCFTLTQIRLCQHVCMTQWNTGIFREIYIKLYRVALQGIWNKKFHITSWIQLVLSCSLGFSSCSFRFNHMYLLFIILPVAGTIGKFKMASKMATNNKNDPLNQNNISNFHSVHSTLYFNTFVFIRKSNAYREGI